MVTPTFIIEPKKFLDSKFFFVIYRLTFPKTILMHPSVKTNHIVFFLYDIKAKLFDYDSVYLFKKDCSNRPWLKVRYNNAISIIF